jgi:pyroglutamyl-peptidase
MLTVLLTGFLPFDGAVENPSRVAVLALADQPVPGVRLATAVLPVTYADTWPALHDAILRHRPDVVIATGLAGGRIALTVERVAINVDDARTADNAGVRRVDTPVVADGPAGYFSTLPIKAMVAAMRRDGVPAAVSQTAGTFLCNHVFYRACHLAAAEFPAMRVGFVHLPWLPEQVVDRPEEPSMALATIVAGLRAGLLAVRDTEQDVRVAEGAVS